MKYFWATYRMPLNICVPNRDLQFFETEIFKKSQCIWHENTLMNFFRSNLTALGYTTNNINDKVWRRGDRTVVICLADDFVSCSPNESETRPYLFDHKTLVITDNHVNVPTQYRVCQLPNSFFGIYAHTPDIQSWTPDRRFNFSVNRLDSTRLLLFLELQMKFQGLSVPGTQIKNLSMPDVHNLDYINFNCWGQNVDPGSTASLQNNFRLHYMRLPQKLRNLYEHTYLEVLPKMPFCNHTLTHEQSHTHAHMNVVIETYHNAGAVALSEKTFRAMCLPVPWIVYAGQYTVAYLASLGFDVLFDVIKHKYDNKVDSYTGDPGSKEVDFLFEGAQAIKHMNIQQCTVRAAEAAATNRSVLHSMQKAWPADFASWWPGVVQQIS